MRDVLLMSFSDFHGNADIVHRLREMLAHDRFPQAVILSGPWGSGKYTLALMLARAMNCLSPTITNGLPDFCGMSAGHGVAGMPADPARSRLGLRQRPSGMIPRDRLPLPLRRG